MEPFPLRTPEELQHTYDQRVNKWRPEFRANLGKDIEDVLKEYVSGQRTATRWSLVVSCPPEFEKVLKTTEVRDLNEQLKLHGWVVYNIDRHVDLQDPDSTYYDIFFKQM